MAKKQDILVLILKRYPKFKIDDEIKIISSHPKFKISMMKYINLWYVTNTPSKVRRFLIWTLKYPTGNSEKKMQVLFGWDFESYHTWVFERRKKRPNCAEYYLNQGFSEEEAKYKVSEYQQKMNHSGVEQRVESWHNAFGRKSKEELDEINKKKGVTLESCIIKHGDLKGRFVWNEILKKKGNTSIESIMRRKGVGFELANKIKDDIKHKQRLGSKFSIDYWNNLYPNDVEFAKNMFRLECSTRIYFSKQSCMERHGEEKGLEIWQDRQDQWQETLNSKSQEEKDEMNSKKSTKRNYAHWNFPKNDIGCFYVIQLNEDFIKIGITYRDVSLRYKKEHLEGCIIIKEEFDTLEKCFALEQLLKIELSDFKISKNEKYRVFGWTETFKIEKEFLLTKIDELKSIDVVEIFKKLNPGYY